MLTIGQMVQLDEQHTHKHCLGGECAPSDNSPIRCVRHKRTGEVVARLDAILFAHRNRQLDRLESWIGHDLNRAAERRARRAA